MDGRPRRGLWAPLAIADANTLLSEGGYGLRIERTRPGPLRLAGNGAGVGLPLGGDPTWADLYRALVRLRRTRRQRDPSWLHHLTRLLEGQESADGGEIGWIRVPAPRVERLAVADGLSPAEQWCLNALQAPDGSVLFPAGSGASGTAPEVAERAEAEVGIVDRSEGRLTVCPSTTGTPDHAVQLRTGQSGSRMTRDEAARQLDGWEWLATAVRNDPLLAMHCATQPARAAVVDTGTGTAMLTRVAEPSPPHPKHPGGTIVADVQTLLRTDSAPALLSQIIENRFERREDELGYFVEHFVRPLVRTFRLVLDTHRLGLYGLDRVGFELSPELQATGRVVLTDFTHIRNRDDASETELCAGIRALSGVLDALGGGFSRIPFDGGSYPESRVRAVIDRIIAEELRYLQPDTAELLSCDQPWRCFVHTVPSQQNEVLKDVLHTVQERTRVRRWNRRLPRPAVVIDLDLCGLVPLQRTLDSARAISGPRDGAPEGIFELARPDALPVLPTFAESTWRNFVESSGLGAKYPLVDWHQVRVEFVRAFSRSAETLRTDTVTPGLARFVWDVQDAGGRVVFCTGRRERARPQTEEVLACGGVPDAHLVCMPDERTRPVSELKVEKLRELGELDVVAVFDDLLANRIAITKEFTETRAVAVEIPGLASERPADQPAADRAPVIASFETSPRADSRSSSSPRLSHAHSLEELQVGALRTNRLANRWEVRLSTGETMSIVDSVVTDADAAAERTAQRARVKAGLCPESGPESDLESESGHGVLQALHHVFTRKQFLKGSRSHYRYADMCRDAEPFVRSGQPIDVVLLGFPVKQCLNRLKASGPLPDLAEFGAVARLRELSQAVRAVYPPGLHFHILTDGRHFRRRPVAVTEAYSKKLREYVGLAGIGECTTVEEIDTVARQRIGPDATADRSRRSAGYRSELAGMLDGFDITDNPLRTLEAIDEFAERAEGPLRGVLGLFRDILMSVVYSVPVPVPAGVDRLAWSSVVYADLYNLTDRGVSSEVRRTRAAVLRRAWHTVIRYLATLRVDEELGYEQMFGNRIRLTVSAAMPGRCGFTYLGGSGLLPWQGTGVVDRRGYLAVDFAVSMFDQGFVPVHSPLLGSRQPWLMVPAQHTRWSRSGMRLDDGFAECARLRRK